MAGQNTMESQPTVLSSDITDETSISKVHFVSNSTESEQGWAVTQSNPTLPSYNAVNDSSSNSKSETVIDVSFKPGSWVDVISKSFRSNLKLEVDFPTCVFVVPKSLRDSASQAYSPNWLGLGPYHHFRQGFYVTEKHKLAITKNYLLGESDEFGYILGDEQIKEIERNVIGRLVDFEPAIRACYDEFLELDSQTLAWIMTMDSLYLLHHLGLQGHESRNLAQDLFMLENQIPTCVLREIQKSLPVLEGVLFPELFHKFCEALCPIKLKERQLDFRHNCRSHHLLDHMYRLILNRDFLLEPVVLRPQRRSGQVWSNLLSSAEKIATIAGAGALEKHIQFIKSLPWQQAKDLFSTSTKSDDEESQLRVVKIPSATQLHKELQAKFKPSEDGGIIDDLVNPKGPSFLLPVITLDSDCEVILRNLLAYEAAVASPGSTLVLAEYVDLMCGIVDSPEDAKFLRDEKIIKGNLNDEQVALLFRRMTAASGSLMSNTSKLQKAIHEVNMRYNNTFKIKCSKFIKNSFTISWKVLAVFSTVLLIILFTLQSFCNIYGCSSRWFHYKTLSDIAMM